MVLNDNITPIEQTFTDEEAFINAIGAFRRKKRRNKKREIISEGYQQFVTSNIITFIDKNGKNLVVKEI